jgi:hypothetical protein
VTQPPHETQPPAAEPALPETICFTSFTLAYLSRARVMAQTVKAAHPDWAVWALLVDELPPEGDLDEALAPFDRVVPADALNIPAFPGWMFKHDVVEGCTAVKPTMLLALLQAGRARGGANKIIYLDPDIAVFHALTDIEARLDTASVVLTPHQLSANDTASAIADNEMTSLKYGIFNLGFIAVRNDARGHDFAQWWTRMTRAACYDDVAAGIFTDQKYCDIVPSLFEGVHIERDPGCNVASWNLSRRKLRFTSEGGLTVNGSPLKFYHFTKIGGIGAVMTERYAHANTEVYEVVNWYKREVRRNTIADTESHPWRYGRFANGQTVPRAARLLWRERPDLAADFIDPFRTGAGSFHAWLQRECPEILKNSGK